METLNIPITPFAIRFPAMVERLYITPPGAPVNGEGIEAAIHNHFAAMSAVNHTWKRDTFYTLLMVMYNKKCYGVLKNPAYIDVLANISSFGNKTVRPVESWTKDNLTADGQLASMIRHLFAKYEVPKFMEHVFAENSKIHMHWYIQLGRGDSAQSLCALPVVFTKKMAHAFRETPASLTIEQALRRAQGKGFGATAQIADAITWANVIEEITNRDFRANAIRFAAHNAGTAGFGEVQTVFEYLADIYRENPAYSLKGRTWASVSRAAAEHLREKAKRQAAENSTDWAAAPVGNYEAVEGNSTYRIVQLLTGEELYEEGREMSHCVAEYDYDCMEGSKAIFSLRKYTRDVKGYDTLATLEVFVAGKELIQAKAKFNEYISAEAEIHVLAWVAQENLTVDCELYEFYAAPQPEAHYQGGIPVAELPVVHAPANAPRIVPRYNAEEAYRRRIPEPENDNFLGMSPATWRYIIIFIIKLLVIFSRMR